MKDQAQPRSRAMVTVGLRYDDCSARSPRDVEEEFLEACTRHRVPVTFGVIPAITMGEAHDAKAQGEIPFPPDRWEALVKARDAGALEIALHGYSHRTARPGERSEFAGVPPAKQSESIRKGKAVLEPFAGRIRTFIPPWNAYDANTLAALKAEGFEVFSADPRGTVTPGLRYVPATCLFLELRKAVEEARRRIAAGAENAIVIAYFHPYEFKEADPLKGLFSMSEFEETLAWLADQKDVETLTLSDIAGHPAAAPEAFAGYARAANLTPPFLEKKFRPAFRVYPDPGFPLPGGKLLLVLTLSLFYLALIPASSFAFFFLGRKLKQPSGVFPPGRVAGFITGTAAFIGLSVAIRHGSFLWACGAALILGAALGLWRSTNRKS